MKFAGWYKDLDRFLSAFFKIKVGGRHPCHLKCFHLLYYTFIYDFFKHESEFSINHYNKYYTYLQIKILELNNYMIKQVSIVWIWILFHQHNVTSSVIWINVINFIQSCTFKLFYIYYCRDMSESNLKYVRNDTFAYIPNLHSL